MSQQNLTSFGEIEKEPTTIKNPENIVYEYDIDQTPEDVPIGAGEAKEGVANRLISHLIREYGHHDPARRAILDWAKGETVREVFEKAAFNLGIGEFTSRSVTDMEKVDLLHEFADAEHPDLVDAATQDYNDHIRSLCETQQEEEAEQAKSRAFEENPPESVNGWEKFDAEKPDVIVAYRGVTYGTESIVAVYKNELNRVDAHETTREWWGEADTAEASKVNRHMVRVSRDDTDVWRDLLNHLETFDAEPWPDSGGVN